MSAPRLLAPTTISGGIPTAGAGTANTIALWTPDNFTLGNSLLTQAGSVITNATGAIRANGTTQSTPAFMRYDATTSGIYFPATNEIGFTISSQHAMFISSGRLVGIGTVSPGAKLHSVAADGTYQFAVSGTTRAVRFLTNAAGANIEGVDPTLSASYQPLTIGGSTVTLANSGSPALTVNTSGNVGIGTASPVTTLANTASAIDDGANGVATTGLTWSPNAVGFAAGFWNKYGAVGNGLFVRTSDTSSSTRVFHVCAGAGAVPNSLLFVRGDGFVGIGTASPSKLLSLYSAGDPVFAMTSGAVRTWEIGVQNSSGALYWVDRTAVAERMRIDTSGNVGIGTGAATTTPAATGSLVIGQNNVSQQWAARIYGGNDANRAPVLSLFRAGNTEGIIAEIKNGAVGALALGITGGVANFNDATLSAACQVQITSTLMDISGASYGLKLPATPGNADAQTLDCYQDGGAANSGGVTWTPALRFGGATTGITGSQVGRYTRIGNMVFAQGTIALSSKGSATGAASIAGLPTSANVAATIYYSVAIGYNSKVTFTGQLHGLISVNSGIVELYQTSTAGVVSAITNTDFAADSVLTFTVCYPVT